MRAHGHRWTAWIAIFAVVLTLGCRGSRPFSRFVNVSEESDASGADIEAPRQRLATAKPRTEVSDSAQQTPRQGSRLPNSLANADDSPHVQQQAAAKRTLKPELGIGSSEEPNRTASTKPAARPASEQIASLSSPQKKSTSTSKAAAGSEKLSNGDLITEFSDYPPEVQQEALRKLVAASARSAERTQQPNSVEEQLIESVSNLPELAETNSSQSDVPPQRLAKKSAGQSSTVDLVSDKTDAKASSNSKKAKSTSAHVTDLATTEIESNVTQSLSDKETVKPNSIKPASATSTDSDASMIAQAVVDEKPLIEEVASEPEVSVSEAASSTSGTDQELYGKLLERLTTAPAGETDSQRSSRMIKLRHLMVLAGKPDAAVQQIEGMSKSEQEFLRHQLLGLWTMIDPNGHPVPSRRFSTAVPQIRQAAQFAAASTDALEVRALAFCTEIESYGQIKPFPKNEFDAGQQVIMYCEIENFTANKTETGFETNLQGSYDIFNAENQKVLSQLLPADNQVSANYLRDYFIAYQMFLPQQLSAGEYRIQLTIEDVNGKKYGQASLPFKIKK